MLLENREKRQLNWTKRRTRSLNKGCLLSKLDSFCLVLVEIDECHKQWLYFLFWIKFRMVSVERLAISQIRYAMGLILSRSWITKEMLLCATVTNPGSLRQTLLFLWQENTGEFSIMCHEVLDLGNGSLHKRRCNVWDILKTFTYNKQDMIITRT